VWSLDFLNGSKQFVKIGESATSTITVGAGTPQGTVSGPNDLILHLISLIYYSSFSVKNVNDDTASSLCRPSGLLHTKQWNAD